MIVLFFIMIANWARGRPPGKLLRAALILAILAPASASLSSNPAVAIAHGDQQVAPNVLPPLAPVIP
ncbi:hypothetical protein [Bradyrhizobium sp.]|uniref:hypothetical protein n=1 Tax=Bradyrhizobium sp. TaxID=376 RepID=UPI0025B8166D|nr:hypothetical protein [Bradyrhizobium sp.]